MDVAERQAWRDSRWWSWLVVDVVLGEEEVVVVGLVGGCFRRADWWMVR